jgi:colanic acid biosynthesis glycosyl transferase WcaI
MRERRVVFVNRYFYPDHSATSQLLSDLAFHLAANGVAVTVVTGSQAYDDASVRLPPRERVQDVEIHRIPTTRFGRANLWGRGLDYLTFYLISLWTLIVLLRRGDIVVAKTDPPLISIVAAVAARLRGATLVNWVQDLFPEVATALRVTGMRVVSPMLCALRNLSLRAATCNVAIGEGMASRFLAQGVDADRVQVIHNWCCAPDLQPIPSEQVALRHAWGLADKFVVGYSGNMGRAHEFETILGAARLLVPDPEIVFLFIGDGAQRARIAAQAEEWGLANITFRPYQPLRSLGESLCVPDVHLVSLRRELEGLIVPSKFYGIVAAGRAVIHIGSPSGEMSRLIAQAGCGISIDPGNARGLAAAIEQLALDPKLCRAMGERARALHRQRFDRRLALDLWLRALSVNPRLGVRNAASYVRHTTPE